MFKSFTSISTVPSSQQEARRRRRVFRESIVSFSDTGGRVLTVRGIGDLRYSAGNSYKASLYRVSATRVALRIHNSSGTGIATYVGNSTGSGDEIRQLVVAAAGNAYVDVIFHKNSSASFSPSINFADATSFRGGAG